MKKVAQLFAITVRLILVLPVFLIVCAGALFVFVIEALLKWIEESA